MSLPGFRRNDELGDVAEAVDFELTARKDAQAAREQNRIVAEQRKFDIAWLAGEVEAAGEIIETVSSASSKIQGSARSLTDPVNHNRGGLGRHIKIDRLSLERRKREICRRKARKDEQGGTRRRGRNVANDVCAA